MDSPRQVDIDHAPTDHQPMPRVQRGWVLALTLISWLLVGVAFLIHHNPWLALFTLFCSLVAARRLCQDWRLNTTSEQQGPQDSSYQP